MKRLMAALALLAALLDVDPARAATAEDLRALYARFYTAQNARDVARVRETLLELGALPLGQQRPRLPGRETMLAWMAELQEGRDWEVAPELTAPRSSSSAPTRPICTCRSRSRSARASRGRRATVSLSPCWACAPRRAGEIASF